LLEDIFYALLGGYVMAALASPDIEAKIGKPEGNERKDFCYPAKRNGNSWWKEIFWRKLQKLLMHHNKVLFIKFLLNWKIIATVLTNFLYLSSLFSILGKCLNKTKQ